MKRASNLPVVFFLACVLTLLASLHLILFRRTPVVAGLQLERHLRTVSADVSQEAVVRYLNFFELRFAWAVSPESLGLSSDERNLAARVTRIYLRRGEP